MVKLTDRNTFLDRDLFSVRRVFLDREVFFEILREIAEERVVRRPLRRHLRCRKRRVSCYDPPPASGNRRLPPCIGIVQIPP